jgi:hypothetical protein
MNSISKSLTPSVVSLQSYYEQLHTSAKAGDLESCLAWHFLIAQRLRESGAIYTAERHYALAKRVNRVLKVLNQQSLPPRAFNDNSVGVIPANLGSSQMALSNEIQDTLELKLIRLLSHGVRSHGELLRDLFGGYASETYSMRLLHKLVDGVNRHLAKIIDSTEFGYQLRLSQPGRVL